jgi:hypothetical protein
MGVGKFRFVLVQARGGLPDYGYARMGWWHFALVSLLVLWLLGIGLVLGILA